MYHSAVIEMMAGKVIQVEFGAVAILTVISNQLVCSKLLRYL